jgi:glycosyltransferase involved in cell wall biosynthesis
VLDVPSGWVHAGRLLRRLHGQLRLLQPDVVLVTGWNEPGLIAASPMIRAMGVPIIMRGESNTLSQRSLVTRCIHRVLLSCSSAAVVIGSSNRDFYLRNGLTPDRLFPGAYFVESERILRMATEHRPQRERLREQAGFDADDFVFCFVGKHVHFKRPELMIQAAAIARDAGHPVKLLFAGSGELTPMLKGEAERLRVPAVFTGFLNQTELWRAYIPSDAFVLPSTNRETWGLVTNEAMLFGLPVIVSDQVGCGPDLIVEGTTGYLFHGGSEGLAKSMCRLASDRAAARLIGQNARERVLSHYSMPTATNGLHAALESLAI